ncbi:DUF6378 domain-containing protein [bacterium]|nr:DUF6378 domain-containing protein [bacterium]
MSDVSDTLNERGSTYGRYTKTSEISQNIKWAIRNTAGWSGLSSDKKESLEMIAIKMARIVNGDPEYADNWHDIAGYAKLIEDEL